MGDPYDDILAAAQRLRQERDDARAELEMVRAEQDRVWEEARADGVREAEAKLAVMHLAAITGGWDDHYRQAMSDAIDLLGTLLPEPQDPAPEGARERRG